MLITELQRTGKFQILESTALKDLANDWRVPILASPALAMEYLATVL